MDASEQGDAHLVSVLLSSGADPNTSLSHGSGTGGTAAHMAAAKNATETLRLLAASGASLDRPNAHGLRPLDLATRHVTKRLILQCVHDQRLAQYKREQERKKAEEDAMLAEAKRVRDIERAMGLIEVLESSKVGSVHDRSLTTAARMRRLVAGRSQRSAMMNPLLAAAQAVKSEQDDRSQGFATRGRRPALA